MRDGRAYLGKFKKNEDVKKTFEKLFSDLKKSVQVSITKLIFSADSEAMEGSSGDYGIQDFSFYLLSYSPSDSSRQDFYFADWFHGPVLHYACKVHMKFAYKAAYFTANIIWNKTVTIQRSQMLKMMSLYM
jgi:hypothetical protein